MLKIVVVLVTTFTFAGLLIAHPFSSPSIGPVADSPKVAATQPAPVEAAAPPVQVAKAEQWPQVGKSAVQQDALLSGSSEPLAAAPLPSPAPAPEPAQPQTAQQQPVQQQPVQQQPAQQPAPPQQQIRVAAIEPGKIAMTGRPSAWNLIAPVRQPVGAAAAARTDGRHWSQIDTARMKADAIRAQAEALPVRSETRPQVQWQTGMTVYSRPTTVPRRVRVVYHRRHTH